jgi:hypothetical protein
MFKGKIVKFKTHVVVSDPFLRLQFQISPWSKIAAGCGKLRKICGNCRKLWKLRKNCNPQSPPPLGYVNVKHCWGHMQMFAGGGHCPSDLLLQGPHRRPRCKQPSDAKQQRQSAAEPRGDGGQGLRAGPWLKRDHPPPPSPKRGPLRKCQKQIILWRSCPVMKLCPYILLADCIMQLCGHRRL